MISRGCSEPGKDLELRPRATTHAHTRFLRPAASGRATKITRRCQSGEKRARTCASDPNLRGTRD
eukprot:13658548-Alexandrium_andersonii.AAC.1